VKLPGL